jgi:hypothetical protein
MSPFLILRARNWLICSTGGRSCVVVFKGVQGMGIGGDDLLDPGFQDHLGVMIFKVLEQHFLADAPDFVSGVLFILAEDAEIRAAGGQQSLPWPWQC